MFLVLYLDKADLSMNFNTKLCNVIELSDSQRKPKQEANGKLFT